jgi:hypothetical protein
MNLGVAPRGQARLILLVVMIFQLALVTIVGFGGMFSGFAFDAPSRGLLPEMGRWLVVLPVWVSIFLLAGAIQQTSAQLQGKQEYAPLRLFKLPLIACALIASGWFIGTWLWNR